MDVLHGDEMERGVFGLQIQEAIYEIRTLRERCKVIDPTQGDRRNK
jgi:hypothetical protein